MEAVSEPLMHPMQFQVGGSALSLMAKRIGLLFSKATSTLYTLFPFACYPLFFFQQLLRRFWVSRATRQLDIS